MTAASRVPAGARATIAALAVGYVGIYLCRKNLAVAVPLLGDAFAASKAEIGRVASIGTVAYALGKLALGPAVDRVGGRIGFVASLFLVACLGAASAAAPSLAALALGYGVTRFAGAAGWPAMMKLVPSWFHARHGTVVGVLSLSYVAGGVAATLLAREVVARGGGWRAVFAVPALVLFAIALGCALVVRPGPLSAPAAPAGERPRPPWRALLARPQFLVVCGLSLSLTLMRESFNTWNVDFLASVQPGGGRSLATAALQSTSFDLAGGVGIVALGLAYDRTPAHVRRWLIAGLLALLAGLLALLPAAAARSASAGVALLALAGLLIYGPYSLLAGVLAVEVGGIGGAATAAGLIDAVGYVGGVLAGEGLGRVLDTGGYSLGFACLAAITAASALLALGLKSASSEGGLGPP
jgi:sugar phosphate permease